MFGRKEIIEMVGGVQTELEAVRMEVGVIVGAMKEYYEQERIEEAKANAQRMKVLEQRIIRRIDDNIAPMVVKELENTGKRKETANKISQIKLKLSEVYATAQKNNLITDCGTRFTEYGTKTYKLLSSVVLEIAKLNGSKSLNKIANRTNYDKFAESNGVEPLKKISYCNHLGSPIQSVFADIIVKGITDKYVEFLESNFLNESEAK